MGILIDFIKGAVTAESLAIGGTLKPQDATRFIDLVVDQSAFLKRVSVERMSKLKKDIDVKDILGRLLVRVAEGSEPADNQKAAVAQKGKTLSALYAQLFATVLFSALDDNQNVPGYEDSLAQKWAKGIGNDLLDLGFNGIDEDGSQFTKLNKGWIHLAKNSAASVKKNIGVIAETGYKEAFKAIIAGQQGRFKERSEFVMSAEDVDGYISEIGGHPGGLAYVLSGNAPTFMGYPINKVPYCPAGVVLFTPIENYLFGICSDIQRYREVRGTKRCIDYTWNVASDYDFAVDEAVVIGYEI